MHLFIRTTHAMRCYAVDAGGSLVAVGDLEAKTRLEIDVDPLKPDVMHYSGAECIAARIIGNDQEHPGYILLQELCPDALPHGYSWTCAHYAYRQGVGINEAERRMHRAHAHLYQMAYDRRIARLKAVA